MLPSVASTSLAVCLPRLGGTTSGGVFVDVTSVSVAIRSAAGVARCARGHTSIRFAAVSGVASVVKDKFRGVFAIGEIWPKQEDRLAFVFVLGRLSFFKAIGRTWRCCDRWRVVTIPIEIRPVF